jgi:hypothetical protein
MNRLTCRAVVVFGLIMSVSGAGAQEDSKYIRIDAPHGGEVYVVGQMQRVQIHSPLRTLTLELSRDGGTTFEALGMLNKRSALGQFAWTVAGPATTNAVIRASGTRSGAEVATVSSAFSIDSGALLGGGAVTTGNLADGAVTNPKLAPQSVTADKVGSGASSGGFVLAADGSGGALWQSLLSLLPTVGAPYVLKTGDSMSGGLKISTPTTGLTVTNDAANQSTVAIGPAPPTNGSLSIGATQNGFNISVFDVNPNLLLSDNGTTGSAAFIQFREQDQLTIRAQLAAFSSAHPTKANWLGLSNFRAGPVVFSTSNTERMRVDSGGNVGIATPTPNSNLQVNGSFALPVRTSAVSTALNAGDYVLVLTGAGTTPTLPDATGIAGRIYVVKNRSGGALTPATTAGETIDGTAPAALSNNAVLIVQSDGANWNKIN